MKTHSSDLFDLIKVLTPYEKRCYLKDVELGENAYTQLFLLISKSQDFKENHYIKSLENQGIKAANYPRIKNYLYKDILQFLAREELKKNSIQKDLREAVEGIRILIERSLTTQAEKLLKKSKITALKYNIYTSYTELLNLEYLIIRSKVNSTAIRKSVKNLKYDITNLKEFYARYLNIVVTELDTFYTIMGIQGLDYKSVYLDEHIDIDPVIKAFNNETFLMQDLLSINAGYLLALREHFKNNNAESLKILLKSIALFDKNPSLKKAHSYKYVLILNNLGDSALMEKNFAVTDRVIDIMRKEKSNSTFFENSMTDISINIGIRRIWIKLEDSKVNLNIADEITNEALKKEHWSIPRVGIEALFKLIAINFKFLNYSACIKLINQLLKLNKSNLETESLCAITIIELIIHSEYQNYDLIISKALSLKKIKSNEKKYLYFVADFFRYYTKHNFVISKAKIEQYINGLNNIRSAENEVITQKSNLSTWLEKIHLNAK